MGANKFFGEQGPEHNGRLYWSQANLGVPFRGNAIPLLKDSELEDSLEIHFDFHCKEFDLTNDKERNEYIKVMDRIVNGWYYLHTKTFVKDEKGRVIAVYLEWSQRYTQLNPYSVTNITTLDPVKDRRIIEWIKENNGKTYDTATSNRDIEKNSSIKQRS